MGHKTYSLTAGVVFLLIALGHLLRVIFRATLVIAGVSISMAASVIAVIVVGYLAYEGLRLGGKSRSRP